MGDLCINCNKKPVKVKKRRLCQGCYNIIRYQEYKEKMVEFRKREGLTVNQMFCSEVEFIRNFFTHNNWVFHPCSFNLNGQRYYPDFYDVKRNVFIEVSGTRQAFHSNFDKYKLFIKTFPKIKFEIRDIFGNIKPLTKKTYAKKQDSAKNKS